MISPFRKHKHIKKIYSFLNHHRSKNENIRRMIKSVNQWIIQMTNLPSGQVDQDIVKVTIAQTDDVANHGHDSGGAGVGLHHVPPLPGPCAGTPQLSAQAPYNPVSPTAPQTGTTQPCQPQSSTNRDRRDCQRHRHTTLQTASKPTRIFSGGRGARRGDYSMWALLGGGRWLRRGCLDRELFLNWQTAHLCSTLLTETFGKHSKEQVHKHHTTMAKQKHWGIMFTHNTASLHSTKIASSITKLQNIRFDGNWQNGDQQTALESTWSNTVMYNSHF